MATSDWLTFEEFMYIKIKLDRQSTTWGDLWLTAFLLKADVGRVVKIKHEDIIEGFLYLRPTEKYKERKIYLNNILICLFDKRKELYPDDIYLFQSKSNRVKYLSKPVTVIAMNVALKEASLGVTDKNVTMKSASRIIY